MVAELQLTDPLLEIAVDGILVLGVSGRESYIFESSQLPYFHKRQDQPHPK